MTAKAVAVLGNVTIVTSQLLVYSLVYQLPLFDFFVDNNINYPTVHPQERTQFCKLVKNVKASTIHVICGTLTAEMDSLNGAVLLPFFRLVRRE